MCISFGHVFVKYIMIGITAFVLLGLRSDHLDEKKCGKWANIFLAKLIRSARN